MELLLSEAVKEESTLSIVLGILLVGMLTESVSSTHIESIGLASAYTVAVGAILYK